MSLKKYALIGSAAAFIIFLSDAITSGQKVSSSPKKNDASIQPTAIFHAFNQPFNEVESLVCDLADQGFSHVQISPVQKSNPGRTWWKRYQPLDLGVIEGLGNENDLIQLINKAHGCDVNVIADVVLNHMANMDEIEEFEDLSQFNNLSVRDFNTVESNPGAKPCDINYNDGNRISEVYCWLGGLPDLKFTDNVKTIQKSYLKRLIDLGIDGFRFDAAKHLPAEILKEYIEYINQESEGQTWNYLEVISDSDTPAEDYSWIAAVSDFTLYRSLRQAFTYGGDLRSLPPQAIDDPRSITFGTNHDTIKSLNAFAIDPYDDVTDSYLATAYVLARQGGTPLVFNDDYQKAPYLRHGAKFRQIMRQRSEEGLNVSENVLRAIDSSTVLMMERGAEGFFVQNKATEEFDITTLDLTLSNLEGCYRELRNDFTVAIERRDDKKYVTRWGSWERGGIEVQARDALYFIREPFDQCQS